MRINLENNSNNQYKLWNNLMKKDITKEEKLKLLQEDLKKRSLDKVLSEVDEDELDKLLGIDDSKLTDKQKQLKKIIKRLKCQSYAERMAKGKKLTDKEIKYLKKNAPELIAKAKSADRHRKALENRIRNAKTKKEADDVLFEARSVNIAVSMKFMKEENKELSNLMNASVDQAIENTKNIINKKSWEDRKRKINRYAQQKNFK